MALFSRKQKIKEEAPVKNEASKQASLALRSLGEGWAHVLKNPRITEKASMHQSIGVYTFDVAERATKTQIAAAVREVYKVTPRKIAVVTIHAKKTRSMRTGKVGMKSGGKKAYVYLKNGETITIS